MAIDRHEVEDVTKNVDFETVSWSFLTNSIVRVLFPINQYDPQAYLQSLENHTKAVN